MGDAFQAGSWNNGAKYKWMNLIAVIEIAIISVYFILPFVPAGVPFTRRLRLEVRQLRTDPDDRLAARARRVVAGLGPQVVQGPEAHHRPGGRRGLRRVSPGVTLDQALAQLPALAGAREVSELPGGLTNHNYRVRTATHDVVVRISPPTTDLLAVNREHEWLNSRAAAAAGVGRPGRGLPPGAGRARRRLPPRADVCRERRGRQPAADRRGRATPARRPALRARLRHLRRPARLPGHRHPARVCESPRGMPRWASRRRASRPRCVGSPNLASRATTTCWRPTSSMTAASIRIVDYEYSGTNEASFELGNLVNESQLDHDHLVELVEAYYGRVDDRLLARAELWGLAGRYAWTLWGAIQHGVSDVDHDFWDFALERHDLAAALFTSPRLDDLIDAATSRAARSTRRPEARRERAAAATRPGRHHRRRGDRLQRRLPPGPPRLDRRAAARAGLAVRRHDLARRRPGRPAAGHRGQHPARAVLDRPLLAPRGRDRAGDRLPRLRRPHRGPHPGADGGAAAHGRQRRGIRPRLRAAHRRGGARALPAHPGRRPRRRHLAARRRAGQPDRPHPGPGEGRADAWGADRRAGAGHRRADAAAGGPAGCAPTRATSRPSSSSTVPGSGPRPWGRWSASPCRCTRPSTSTS